MKSDDESEDEKSDDESEDEKSDDESEDEKSEDEKSDDESEDEKSEDEKSKDTEPKSIITKGLDALSDYQMLCLLLPMLPISISTNVTDGAADLAQNIQQTVGNVGETLTDVTDVIGKTSSTVATKVLDVIPTPTEAITGLNNIGEMVEDKSSEWVDNVGTSTSEAMKTVGEKSSELVDVTSEAMKTVGEKSSELVDVTNAIMKSVEAPKIGDKIATATTSAMKTVEDSIETLLPTEDKLGLLNDSAEKKEEDTPSSNTKIII